MSKASIPFEFCQSISTRSSVMVMKTRFELLSDVNRPVCRIRGLRGVFIVSKMWETIFIVDPLQDTNPIVREDEVKDFCDKQNMQFFLTSALTGDGVESFFQALGVMVNDKWQD
eukprot:TRINITY_DN1600_c1_g1_i1.p2 TRINITY_DN1600_c1_g1~~TRINITY_DN1600_c1_g1_i1.p2  ORF type:complete len:114 (-),score=8.10 TRINITY_DN1600_c1_g1_i1:182-523(-)